jgi:hypothetical protein
MPWIKRNLYFLVGAVVSVGLLAVAVVYYFQKEGANSEVKEKLNAAYSELKRINDLNPHPGYANSGGSTSKVDNISIGQRQIKDLGTFLGKARLAFVPVPSIPDNPKLSGQEFTADLLRTIDQMRRDCRGAGIAMPASNYNFSFDSIAPKVSFSASSLQLLARQLGEVKVMSDVLAGAKINQIEGLRRVKVCNEDDPARFPNDYLSQTPQTNEMAVLEPFELRLRCFSAELAGVMAGFANSPYGVIVKSINIEAVPPSTDGMLAADGGPQPGTITPVFTPQPMPPPPGGGIGGEFDRMARMRSRYGAMGGAMPPPPMQPVPVMRQPPPANRAPQPVLYEQAVRVTLTVVFVHLDDSKGDAAGGKGRRGGGRRQ